MTSERELLSSEGLSLSGNEADQEQSGSGLKPAWDSGPVHDLTTTDPSSQTFASSHLSHCMQL